MKKKHKSLQRTRGLSLHTLFIGAFHSIDLRTILIELKRRHTANTGLRRNFRSIVHVHLEKLDVLAFVRLFELFEFRANESARWAPRGSKINYTSAGNGLLVSFNCGKIFGHFSRER